MPEHAEWISTTVHECGLGPPSDGGIEIAYCNWSIVLGGDGTGSWSHSDVHEFLDYSCAGSELTLSGVIGAEEPTAAPYDPETGYLTFLGVTYCPAGTVGCPLEPQ